MPPAAGVGVAGDERQQVTPRLDLDFVHLVRLDDLHINHGIGERFPQIGNRYGIARLQAVYVPKIIRAICPAMTQLVFTPPMGAEVFPNTAAPAARCESDAPK